MSSTLSYFANLIETADTSANPSPEIDTTPSPKRSNKVCGIILRKQNHFLTVYGKRASVWSFPKGHVEPGETDWQCAIREFVEETGMYVRARYTPRRFRLGKGVFFLFDEDTYDLLGTVNPQDTDEVGDVRWMTPDELSSCEGNRYIKLFMESQYPRLEPYKSLPLE